MVIEEKEVSFLADLTNLYSSVLGEIEGELFDGCNFQALVVLTLNIFLDLD